MQEEILLVGHDPVLLATRAMILRRKWPTALATPQCAIRRIQEDHPALVVLCHTLSGEEADSLVGVCHTLNPAVRTIEVVTRYPRADHIKVDTTVEVISGPSQLVKAVEDLLQSCRRSS